jgi:hypothetical protein
MKFKVAKKVTHQQIKLEPGVEYAFRLESAIYLGKENTRKPDIRELKHGEPAAEKQTPPHLLHVVQLDTGEEGVIVCPSVLVSELEENYPESTEGAGDWDYVGRYFQITILGKKAGKRYHTVSITELLVDEDLDAEEVEEPKKKGVKK